MVTDNRILDARLSAALDAATPLAQLFEDAGHRLYFVGGVVRDSLLHLERAGSDLDGTTAARPEMIKEIVAGLADAVWSQGERFGTIGCRIDGRVYEITTHRAERYEPGSRKPVVSFGESLDEDLSRRDFTVNAMAVDIVERRVIDLFGGEADLRDGVLRTPLDPSVSFSDDPLRMLRAARFHAGYGLEPVPELTEAISAMTDRIKIVSAERIREELEKLLMLTDPARGLEMLRSTGLMTRIVPELAHLDAGELKMRSAAVSAVEARDVDRWAALLVDHSTAGQRLKTLRASGTLIADTGLLLRFAAEFEATDPSSRPAVRRLAAMGNRRLTLERAIEWSRRCAVAAGISHASLDLLEATVRDLRSTEPDLDDPDVGLNGDQVCEVLGIEPGVDVGRALAWLRELRFAEGVVARPELRKRLLAWWTNSRAESGS